VPARNPTSSTRLSPLSTLRALARLPVPGSLEAVAIPPLERVLPASAATGSDKLARFAALTHYGDGKWLPLTWPHVAAFPAHLANLVDPRFPLPLPGLVHVAFHAYQSRPVERREPLTLSASLAGAKIGPKGLTFDLVTKAWSGHEKVWEGTATMLSRGKKRATSEAGDARPPLDGPSADERTWMIPARVAPSFARVTGDVNPIHLTPWSAKLFGFGGVVVHGMWTATRLAAAHPELHDRQELELDCAFKLPIILPAKVLYRSWREAPSRKGQAAGRRECRVLSEDGQRPHVVGSLTWREGER
jgi:acyl dehydratase